MTLSYSNSLPGEGSLSSWMRNCYSVSLYNYSVHEMLFVNYWLFVKYFMHYIVNVLSMQSKQSYWVIKCIHLFARDGKNLCFSTSVLGENSEPLWFTPKTIFGKTTCCILMRLSILTTSSESKTSLWTLKGQPKLHNLIITNWRKADQNTKEFKLLVWRREMLFLLSVFQITLTSNVLTNPRAAVLPRPSLFKPTFTINPLPEWKYPAWFVSGMWNRLVCWGLST